MFKLVRSIPGLDRRISDNLSAVTSPPPNMRGEMGVVVVLVLVTAGDFAWGVVVPRTLSTSSAKSLVSGVRDGVGMPWARAVSSNS